MKVFFRELTLNTKRRREILDITEEVERAVRESGVENGLCVVHSMHSTTAIMINEREEGLMEDIISKINEEYPRDGGWLHNRIDDNADAHLAGAFTGPSTVIPIKEGRLCLGTWQDVFFLELDGPRAGRRIVIEVLGL